MASSETTTAPSNVSQRVYNVIFPGPIPEKLSARFAAAWRILSEDYSESDHVEFQEAVASISDIEALELVCRRRKRLPVLGAQVALMFMLAETLPSHVSILINRENSPVGGLLSMTAGVFRSAWKLAKGSFLLRGFDARRNNHCR